MGFPPTLGRKLVDYAFQRGSESRLLATAFGTFALLSFYMVFHHVPWRDEATPWIFARTLDLRDLFYVARHDGHPILWVLCVKAVQATGVNYLGMMLLNWAFCCSAIWLLFYRSRLPLIARLGFAYAPICIFELSFTGRNYSIALLLCFMAANFHSTARLKPLRFSLVLALLANTNAYASAVFVGICFQFLLEQALGFGTTSFSLRPIFTRYFVPNAILLLAATLLVAQLAPFQFPGDPSPTVTEHLAYKYTNLGNGYLIIVCLLLLALMFMSKSLPPRILGGIPVVLLIIIPVISYGLKGRHLFMLAAGTVYFCWIYLDAFLAADSALRRKWGETGIKALVAFMILAAAFASKPENITYLFNRPYDARNAAQAIVAENLDRPNTLMLATDSFRPEPLFLFLQNVHSFYVPPEYGPSPQTFSREAYAQTFLRESLDVLDIKQQALDLAGSNPEKTILIVVAGIRPIADPTAYGPGYRLEPIYHTPPSPKYRPSDEAFEIYALKRSTPAP